VVWREGGFTVRLYGPPREHPPAHVHVRKGTEGRVIIRLGTSGAPPEIWRVHHLKYRDVLRGYHIVERHQDMILRVWRSLHG
jgi:hypothetical protein